MNLNYSPKAFSQLTHNEHSKKSAIHKAGHGVLGTMERLWEASHNRSTAPQLPNLCALGSTHPFQLTLTFCNGKLLGFKLTIEHNRKLALASGAMLINPRGKPEHPSAAGFRVDVGQSLVFG